MYKLNLTPAYLSDEQKKDIFNPENLKKTLNNLTEKKEIDEMTEMDILIDTLIQKQNNILNKAQIVDKKGVAYKLTRKGEVLENLIAAYEVVEEDFNSSLESFEKTEDAINNAWTTVKTQAVEAIKSISQQYEEAERQAELDKKLDQLELQKDDFDSEISFVELEISTYEPEISRFYSKDYLVEYSIEESNSVHRGGRMVFNPEVSYQGALSYKVANLIGQYQTELHGGETIKYKGFI